MWINKFMNINDGSKIKVLIVASSLLLLLFIISASVDSHEAINEKERPNILFIVSEDNGPELGCYGTDVQTPNLDKLADSGIRFGNAFVPQAGCSPSKAAFLTGLYPHQNGQIGLATWKYAMYNDNTPNMVNDLEANGYRTGIIGKVHVNPESAFKFNWKRIPVGNFQRDSLGNYAKYAEEFLSETRAPNDLVSTLDLYPTFLELTGQPIPDYLPGQSLIPLFEGKTIEREFLFSEFHVHSNHNPLPQRAIRNKRFKLIHNLVNDENPGVEFTCKHFGGDIYQMIQQADQVVKDAYIRMEKPPEFELYDLKNDPFEWKNLSGDSSYQEVLDLLRFELRKWQRETKDPLVDKTLANKLFLQIMNANNEKIDFHTLTIWTRKFFSNHNYSLM